MDADCATITENCQSILKSCYNPGAVDKPRPTGSILENYSATWRAPETSLPVAPPSLATSSNQHCLATYQHCSTFYETCMNDIRSHRITASFDAEHRAKACYQILLRCQSDIPLCLSYPAFSSEPLETWIPDRVAEGVQVPPWLPDIKQTEENGKCLAGYQRCLILYRNCLLVATMLQDAGWLEKAEMHRNKCQGKLVPLCMNGLSVCEGLA